MNDAAVILRCCCCWARCSVRTMVTRQMRRLSRATQGGTSGTQWTWSLCETWHRRASHERTIYRTLAAERLQVPAGGGAAIGSDQCCRPRRTSLASSASLQMTL